MRKSEGILYAAILVSAFVLVKAVKQEGFSIHTRVKAEKNTNSCFTNSLSYLDKNKVSADIQIRAEADWKDDYEMQEYQYHNQMTAFTNLLRLDINEPHKEIILNAAIREGKGNYETIQSQYENQLKAYQWVLDLNRTDVKNKLLKAAQSNWGNDYEMIQYEYETKLAANHI